jgi:integrase
LHWGGIALPAYKDEQRGTWYVQFYFEDWTGVRKKKYKRGFKTQREAKQWEREFLSKNASDPNMTFDSLWVLYKEDNENRVRMSTKETRDNIVNTHILPYFKTKPIADISNTDVRAWQNTMLKKKNPRTGKAYSPVYLHSINARFSAIMNYAVRFHNLEKNPCDAADSVGKKQAKEMKFWTLDQFNRVIQFEELPAYHAAFMLLYWCGIRSGECLALTKNKVLPDASIKIDATFKRVDYEDVLDDPKTEKSIRTVQMPDFVAVELASYIEGIYGLGEEDRIFYFTKSALNKELDRIAEKADVNRIRVHDLRHSHVALLIELGYSAYDIAERLGNTPAIVDKTYAHLYPDKGKRIADELSRNKDGIAGKKENFTAIES